MMNRKSEYFAINDIALASSLSFLGFRYMRFDDPEFGKVYSFRDTTDFREAREQLLQLQKQYKK
jgi:sensor histidine kinase regulating citrate/malate metabolism